MADECELPGDTDFERLAGLFFDEELSEAEDAEFVALLQSDVALARRFIEMARIDRCIAGLASADGARVSDEEFVAAVRHSLKLDNVDESHRFAREVVELVRNTSERRRTRRFPVSPRPASIAPVAVAAAACLAILAVAYLFASHNDVAGGAPVAENSKHNAPHSPVSQPQPPELPGSAPANEVANASRRESPLDAHKNPDAVSPHVSSADAGKSNGELLANAVTPEVPGDAGVAENNTEPVDGKTEGTATADNSLDTSPSDRSPGDAQSGSGLARIERVTGVTVALQRKSSSNPPMLIDARRGAAVLDDDTIRVSSLRINPGEEAHAAPGAANGIEFTFADGTRVWLAPGSEFRVHSENESMRPTLVSGELIAHVRPQKPGHPLAIHTQQGPVVEVVGTVFRLAAETGRKQVTLSVDEGKVKFSNQGVERRVAAGEICEAEDGRAPGVPARFKPSPAVLTGVVVDKTSGKALVGGMVTAVPQARRKAELHFSSVRTDPQGRFKFDALREGQYFVICETPAPGGFSPHFGLSRAVLKSGEETQVSIAVDKPAVVAGALEESSKHMLYKDFRVQYVPEGSDLRTIDPVLTPIIDGRGDVKDPMHEFEYHCAVIEGAGKYTTAVEKPGLLIKVRTPHSVQLVTERVNNWVLDIQISPSASIKGRVVDATTASPVGDDPGADANDPRQPRTVLTLKPASGLPHFVCAEADGTFCFNTNLDAGVYELKAQRFGYETATHRITLTAGQIAEFDIPMEVKRK